MLYDRFGLVVLSCGLATASARGEATASLVAVAKNGVAITPTGSLLVSPGDKITANVYLSGWSAPPFDGGAGLLNAYQITLAGYYGALSSGACPLAISQMVLPVGWAAPPARDECPCNHPYFPICDLAYGCVAPNHHPEQMAEGPPPQGGVFGNLPSICTLDTSSLDIEWACALDGPGGVLSPKCQGGKLNGSTCTTNADCPGGVCNAQFHHLVGTLFLRVGAAACGTSTYTFDNSATFLRRPGDSVGTIPALEALTLVVVVLCPFPGDGACCTNGTECEMVECAEECMGQNQQFGGFNSTCSNMIPPCGAHNIPFVDWWNCIIDARRPHVRNQPANRQGFTSQTWTFQNPLGSGEDAPDDFTIRQVPAATPPLPPIIGSVTLSASNSVTLHFRNADNTADFPIQPNKWTCVKHNASNVEKCMGYLPGDVNSNRAALPNDILDIIDNLNGIRNPPLMIHQCDIDRSGVCAPADILTEIDLLNGSGFIFVQIDRTLPVCPSAP